MDKTVRQALYERSLLDNTVQLATPFVKVTSTIQHTLLKGGKGFTLGIHATSEDMKYQDIFSSTAGDSGKKYPLIGYTYVGDKNQPVYADLEMITNRDKAIKLNQIFDRNVNLFSTTNETYIPPPGITKASVTRGKAGLLIAADISFSVPTLSQLEVLHRLFLVPGVGIVMEWGQQFAPETVHSPTGDFGETGLNANTLNKTTGKMFPWYDAAKRDKLLERLGKKSVGVEEVMNCYVYPTEGQYMWMFGRVGNFSTKANSDGSFDCTMKIVGPSEDSWAFSTTRTVTPPADPDTKKPCAQSANSVSSYFTKTTSGPNLKTLLDDVLVGRGKAKAWQKHVKKLPKATGAEPTRDTPNPTESEKSFGDSEDAYFMTWRFFVNVVLNHPDVGVKRVFSEAQVAKDIVDKIAILDPYYNDPERKNSLIETPGPDYIDDPHESFVGFNKFLRSTDPSTMLIVSEMAAKESKAKFNPQRQEKNPPDYFRETTLSRSFKATGLFEKSTSAIKDPTPQSDDDLDRGCLSAGVWINHKAVVASMASAETVLRGISNLLDRMNRATVGYWNLSLDSAEPTKYLCEGDTIGNSTSTWTVVDSNYKENSKDAANNFLDNIHVFNKYVRKTSDGKLVGSDVTDCTVDLALPKVMFSQIATMGLVQKKDLQSAGIEPEEPNHRCSDAAISDANEALREMFAITSISQAEGVLENGPDLTAPIKKPETSTCADTNSTAPAAVTGRGTQVDGTNANSRALPASGESANREFPGMENAFRYIEAFPELMTANIRCEGNGFKSNAFGAAPGALSINADLTVPGLAGFRIGELFWIDRIPAFYKAFGAFQVTSIEDSIDNGGWMTKIGAKFNYLGPAWTQAVVQLAGLNTDPPK